MDEKIPSPEEQRRVWTTSRVVGALAVLAIVFFFTVLVFRGCHNDAVEPGVLDPADPLPGVEELEERPAFPQNGR